MSAEQRRQSMEAEAEEAELEAAEGEEEEEEYVEAGGHGFLLTKAMPAWLVSMVVHGVGLMVLALITFPPPTDKVSNLITATPPSEDMEEIDHGSPKRFVQGDRQLQRHWPGGPWCRGAQGDGGQVRWE